MNEWLYDRAVPSDPSDGIYWDAGGDFLVMVVGGIEWWRRYRGGTAADVGQMAAATGVPVYRLRQDWRRNRPYRWELAA